MTASMIGFGLLALVLLGSALGVVLTRNLVHSVLFLALTLVATAGLYLFLEAQFLAGVQVLLYAGGVAVLTIFAVMLTRKSDAGPALHDSHGLLRGGLAAGGIGLVLAAFILRSPAVLAPAKVAAIADLGKGFLGEYLLPFEVLSVLLVGVMVGAIVIARKEDA